MSTSHRLLDLLLEAGFVQKEQIKRRYAIGSEFFRLANLIAHKTSYASLVQPILDELARETGETALFAAYLAGAALHGLRRQERQPQLPALPHRSLPEAPLEWGSTGLAVLAFLPEEEQAAVLRARGGRRPSRGRRLTRAAFAERLAAVRRNGYAFTEGEKLPDSVGIAVPLEAMPGDIVGSLALTIPKMRFTQSKTRGYVQLLRRAQARFSGRALQESAPQVSSASPTATP